MCVFVCHVVTKETKALNIVRTAPYVNQFGDELVGVSVGSRELVLSKLLLLICAPLYVYIHLSSTGLLASLLQYKAFSFIRMGERA